MGIFALLFFSLLFSSVVSYASVREEINKRDQVVQIYQGEIGTVETGWNDGVRVAEYLYSVNLKSGNPWCAAFVSWTFQQSDVIAVKSGWSPSWFPGTHTFYKRGCKEEIVPLPADVFGIWVNSKNRIAHVGFIDKWDENSSYCITVEGNTNNAGSREGDGVYVKRRLKSQIYKISRWV